MKNLTRKTHVDDNLHLLRKQEKIESIHGNFETRR